MNSHWILRFFEIDLGDGNGIGENQDTDNSSNDPDRAA